MGALGAPGGTDIIGGVANVLLQTLTPSFQMSALQNSTDKPRAIGKNAHGESAFVELALWNQLRSMEELRKLGYNLTHVGPPPYVLGESFSRVESAMASFATDGTRLFAGAADSTRFPTARATAPSKSVPLHGNSRYV